MDEGANDDDSEDQPVADPQANTQLVKGILSGSSKATVSTPFPNAVVKEVTIGASGSQPIIVIS